MPPTSWRLQQIYQLMFSKPAASCKSTPAPGGAPWISEAVLSHNPTGINCRTDRCRTIVRWSANGDSGHVAIRVQRELTTAGNGATSQCSTIACWSAPLHDGGRNSSPADVAHGQHSLFQFDLNHPTRPCTWPQARMDTIVETSCMKAATWMENSRRTSQLSIMPYGTSAVRATAMSVNIGL